VSPGLYHNLEEATYRREPGLSVSEAKNLLKSPKHFLWNREHKRQNDAMKFGSMAHAIILQEKAGEYVVQPDLRLKENKGWKEANSTKQWAKQEDLDAAKAMQQSLKEHEDLGDLIGAGDAEVSAFATYLDLPIKGRFDRLIEVEDGWLILDLKCVSDASPEAFAKAVWNFGWHIQARWYPLLAELSGLTNVRFMWAACEREGPYYCNAFMPSASMMAKGAEQMDGLIETYKRYEAMGWPKRHGGIQEIDLPHWIK